MEFRIEKAAFLQALYYAQGIADRKSTMPILANVLLRSDGNDRILVAATDLNLTVTTELPCEVQSEGGPVSYTHLDVYKRQVEHCADFLLSHTVQTATLAETSPHAV